MKVALSGVTAATATVKKGDCFILDGYRYQKDSSDGKIPLSHLFLELRNGVEPADR